MWRQFGTYDASGCDSEDEELFSDPIPDLIKLATSVKDGTYNSKEWEGNPWDFNSFIKGTGVIDLYKLIIPDQGVGKSAFGIVWEDGTYVILLGIDVR